MSDWGRIHRAFWRHPKVKAVSNGAIGLWAKANSWSRHERTAGFIPQDMATTLGSPQEICELVEVGLWDKAEGGFRQHDHEDWNADERPKTIAAKLVHKIIPPDHPSLVRQQLTAKVAELLEEGAEVPIIASALKLWLAKDGAGVSLLPHLVSDALRTRSDAGIEELMRRCYRSGNVLPLAAHGYVYEPPDPPPNATVAETRTFMDKHKREWIKQQQKELKK